MWRAQLVLFNDPFDFPHKSQELIFNYLYVLILEQPRNKRLFKTYIFIGIKYLFGDGEKNNCVEVIKRMGLRYLWLNCCVIYIYIGTIISSGYGQKKLQSFI